MDPSFRTSAHPFSSILGPICSNIDMNSIRNVGKAVIAVAGGTGGVGKTIIEALSLEPKYQVLVLSRSVSEHQSFLWSSRIVLISHPETRGRYSPSSACPDRLR